MSVESKERLIDDLERRIAETIAGTIDNPLKLDGMYEKCLDCLMQHITEGFVTEDQISVSAVEFNKFYKKCSKL